MGDGHLSERLLSPGYRHGLFPTGWRCAWVAPWVSPTTQPDAICTPDRGGVGAGFSFADRGYSVDVGYLHLFLRPSRSQRQLPVRNVAQIAAAKLDAVMAQNNGTYTTSVGSLGWITPTACAQPPSAAKAWHQVWSRGSSDVSRRFGRPNRFYRAPVPEKTQYALCMDDSVGYRRSPDERNQDGETTD